MPEIRYQYLPEAERRDALDVLGRSNVHRAHLLEKDIWVVAVLGVLFDAPYAEHLTFKGGTSLSKAWRAIRRFSEDVDVTYDIRAFAPDLVAGTGEEALPPTRSQQKRWTRKIRERLTEWVRTEALQTIREALIGEGFVAQVRADGDRLFIRYEPLFEETDFVRPEVKLEFGARSTGEPCTPIPARAGEPNESVSSTATCQPKRPTAKPDSSFVTKADSLFVPNSVNLKKLTADMRIMYYPGHLLPAGLAAKPRRGYFLRCAQNSRPSALSHLLTGKTSIATPRMPSATIIPTTIPTS